MASSEHTRGHPGSVSSHAPLADPADKVSLNLVDASEEELSCVKMDTKKGASSRLLAGRMPGKSKSVHPRAGLFSPNATLRIL
ncbi:hypothetical protein HYQ46_012010 [Verticillium longisporum]|nr:hypothetical protein HYQ44_017895 [Verticillium longisporum]KAG7152159.1 hypothetical protein HYQ46_012010 [Verticillium longisporum]